MPKLVKPLTAIEVKRLNKAGFHAVGTISGLGLSDPRRVKKLGLQN